MKKYTYDEVVKASTDYFNGDGLAAEVFAGKYSLRDSFNNLYEQTPEAMHRRMAKEFARIENKYPNPLTEDEIFNFFKDWTIIPQGSPMSAIGNNFQLQSLGNCFVIDSPYDSYGGILHTDQEQAQIMKRRGGVGFDISSIRPKGLPTSNAARTTDGISVFMERFSNTCREVAQGGRRGALMISISVHHPEIRTFINIKKDKTKVTGANISIRLSDEFMNAVKKGENVQLRYPVEPDVQHDVSSEENASQLWDEIITAAHESAEPGLLFWDTIKNNSPADAYDDFQTISTNPCGEIVLGAYGSCRLMLLNLTKFVNQPFTSQASFDHQKFEKYSSFAQRLMDDLVDLEIEAIDKILSKIESDPEPLAVKQTEHNLWKKIKTTAMNGRRTGLGITGLGDMLAMINVTYGEEKDGSVKHTGDVYSALAYGSYRESVKLAKERGSFPAYSFEKEKNHKFIQRILDIDKHDLKEQYAKFGRRNIANTTTAPAGSVSILAQTTSGIEPVFSLSYKRRKKINVNDANISSDFVDDLGDKWQTYDVFHPGFKQWAMINGHDIPSDPKKLDELISLSPYSGATSDKINWSSKIDMQAIAQKFICHAISNTTNIPENTSVDVVKNIYMKGWETGCKGVTIYREGSRAGVLVSNSESNLKVENEIQQTTAATRPNKLACDIHRATVKGEQYMILVGLLNDRPYEIFCGLSDHIDIPKKKKSGMLLKNVKKSNNATYDLNIPIGDDDEIVLKDIVELFDNPTYGTFSRTLSLSMRHGVPIQYVVEQLRKDKHSDITSFATVVARILSKNYIPDGTSATTFEKSCKECQGVNLRYEQGCVTCFDCGSSKCG